MNNLLPIHFTGRHLRLMALDQMVVHNERYAGEFFFIRSIDKKTDDYYSNFQTFDKELGNYTIKADSKLNEYLLSLKGNYHE